MSSMKERLQSADPVAHEPPLSNEAVQQMRDALLTAASTPRLQPVSWRRRAWAVAGAAAVLVTAAGVRHWTGGDDIRLAPAGITAARVETAPRQLQFATPSGTRVIWVFNAHYQP